MPCPPIAYSGGGPANRTWHNWLGNIAYTVPSYFEPSTKADLIWILHRAEIEAKKLKAVGSGWSFEDCAVSEDWVVDLKNLNRTLTFLTNSRTGGRFLTPTWANRQFGASTEKLYHVEAGIKVFDLNRRLPEGRQFARVGGWGIGIHDLRALAHICDIRD
jgi:hypothetical protein